MIEEGWRAPAVVCHLRISEPTHRARGRVSVMIRAAVDCGDARHHPADGRVLRHARRGVVKLRLKDKHERSSPSGQPRLWLQGRRPTVVRQHVTHMHGQKEGGHVVSAPLRAMEVHGRGTRLSPGASSATTP